MRIYLGTGFVFGVPARDMEEWEWRALSPEAQAAAKNLYKVGRKEEPPKPPEPEPEPEPELEPEPEPEPEPINEPETSDLPEPEPTPTEKYKSWVQPH